MTAIELLVLSAPVLLLVMLFPALLELKKPKDGGPRLIAPQIVQVYQSSYAKVKPLVDLEERHELEASLKPFLNVILEFLPNLEV